MTNKMAAVSKSSKTLSGLKDRRAGILLHLTSLPGEWGIGDMGDEAYRFVDTLAECGQSWWQTLPVNPVGCGNSPYSTVCSAAGEPLLINIEKLVEGNFLSKKQIKALRLNYPSKDTRVHFGKARKAKLSALKMAFESKQAKNLSKSPDFLKFCQDEKSWLDDFALFSALSQKYKSNLWSQWPREIRLRRPDALAAERKELSEIIAFEKFCQYFFARQWQQLHAYANKKQVGLIGDIPIFVSFESSDVWANQKYFYIDKDGQQQYVAGVPPDFFCKDGQRWGMALYRWDKLKEDRFSWWIQRFRQMQNAYDAIRIDHFIGFYRYWEIPASAKTARTGKWRLSEGDALFAATKAKLGELPFIAEDLGLVTKEVHELREKYDIPAMKVLQFAFANDGGGRNHKSAFLPHNSVVYTGTHDNDTTVGWYLSIKKETKNKKIKPSYDLNTIQKYFGTAAKVNEKNIHWHMIRDAFCSPANLAIIPWQDVLGLDGKSRMNIPGTLGKNWEWRFHWKQVDKKDLKKLREITEASDRSYLGS